MYDLIWRSKGHDFTSVNGNKHFILWLFNFQSPEGLEFQVQQRLLFLRNCRESKVRFPVLRNRNSEISLYEITGVTLFFYFPFPS